MADLILKPERERSLLRRHPWVFSGAVHHVDGNPASGETVNLVSFKGEFLAKAAFSPHSQIRARVWSFVDEPIDEHFFRGRVRSAIRMRDYASLVSDTNAMRLIHAESDGLPGLVVDRYGTLLVMGSLAAGPEFWKETLADILLEETGLSTIYERSDADVRGLEGLEPIKGSLRGRSPDSQLTIFENDLIFRVDPQEGHKTGFYLDQRDNRLRVRELAVGRDVLDCFSYTGGFTLNALAGGAKSVVAVDASTEALGLAKQNLEANDLPVDKVTFLEGDVFQRLRTFRDEGRSFDMIVLDPPKFAPTTAQVKRASRGYKDINLLAFKLLRPSGILVTFSCSGGVDASLFQKIIASAALDAGVDARILEYLSQGADHPVALNFPEGAYLKGLVCISLSG